jgi:hypothetical protein
MRRCLLVLLTPLATAETTAGLRELVRRALARLDESEIRLNDYTWTRRVDRKEYHSDGRPKHSSSFVFRLDFEDGHRVFRPVERDGQPVTQEEKRNAEEGIRKRLAEIKAMTPEQIEKARQEARKRRQESDWVKEFPEALDYKLAGEEMLGGRAALMLDVSPRNGYRPKNMRARIFEKVRGRVWIDKADSELAKADAEVFETVNIGLGIVGRVEKGTQFHLRRVKVDDGWLPESETMRFAARFLVFKSVNNEITTRNTDYRRRADAPATARAR